MKTESKDLELLAGDPEVSIPLGAEAWQEFRDLLDRPARISAGLEALRFRALVFA